MNGIRTQTHAVRARVRGILPWPGIRPTGVQYPPLFFLLLPNILHLKINHKALLMIVAGMDIGSITTETVILQDSRILSFRSFPPEPTAGRRPSVPCRSRWKRPGSGRKSSPPSSPRDMEGLRFPGPRKMITEITCHARGAFFVHPRTRTVIDIGGQDSKVIRLDGRGRNVDFQMNDKCAAGTGRFLEVMAHALEVRVEDLGRLSLSAPGPSKFPACARSLPNPRSSP